jgi:two-component system, OmpR family, response regulator
MVKRILVIEDDMACREFLSDALLDETYEVASVENGQCALDVIRIFRPHLILLDMYMPVLDGEHFLEFYYDMSGCKAPVIGLSASNHIEQLARLSGVKEFLRKPVDLDQLLACVERYLVEAA